LLILATRPGERAAFATGEGRCVGRIQKGERPGAYAQQGEPEEATGE